MVAPVAVTCGDPAGIGPDLALTLSQAQPGAPLVVRGDREVLTARARQLALDVTLQDWTPGDALPNDALAVWHCPTGVPVRPGQPDPATAAGTLALLDR